MSPIQKDFTAQRRVALDGDNAVRLAVVMDKGRPRLDIRRLSRATPAPALFATGEGLQIDLAHLPQIAQALADLQAELADGGFCAIDLSGPKPRLVWPKAA